MGPYEFLWVLMRPCGSIGVLIGLYVSLCVFMRPYASFKVLINSNWSSYVLMYSNMS